MTNPALVSARVVFVDDNGRLTQDGLQILNRINEAVSGGGPFQPLNIVLTGLAGMGPGTGLVAQTAVASFAKRTMTATVPLQIANGGGVAGAPALSVDAATDTASGVGELATSAETITGTDTTRAVTPAGAAAAYQPLDADLTSWAGVTRAAGFDTFTATPSSANLKTLVTDETGSGGALVFATGPTLNGPIVQTNAIDLQVGQITFPAVQNASADAHTLDDYEEGTWTPAFTLTTTQFDAIGYSVQEGDYEKNGRTVRVTGHITVNSLTVGAAAGNLQISGLPFAAAGVQASIYIGFIANFTANTPISGLHTGTSINLYHRTAITGGSVVSTFTVVSATSNIYFSSTYHV